MPSRNKKNKNRNNNGNATSGGNASKNGSNTEKISEDSGDKTNVDSQLENLQSLSDAKEKLNQLQESVDAIKASISQANVSADEVTKTVETSTSVEPQTNPQQSETQTMKKKRNRNRNRKKNAANANESGTSASESGVSSTYGTHESSPTISASITLPSVDVITSEIREEPSQVETVVIADDGPTDVVEVKTQDVEIAIQQPLKISDEPEKILDQTEHKNNEQTVSTQESKVNEEQPKIEDSTVDESQTKCDFDKQPVPNELKAIESTSELKPDENKQRLKENDKQNKKQRQGKNANNNNQSDKLNLQVPSEQLPGIDSQNKEKNVVAEELKGKKSPETKTKNNKNAKSSPNSTKKVQPKNENVQIESIDVLEQKSTEEIVEQKSTEITEASNTEVKDENRTDVEAANVSSTNQNHKEEELVEPTEQVSNIGEAGENIDAQNESVKLEEVKLSEQTIEKKQSDLTPSKESRKFKGKKSPPQISQPSTSEKHVETEVIEEIKTPVSEIEPTPIEVKEENVETDQIKSEISTPIAEILSEVSTGCTDGTKGAEIENDASITKKELGVAVDAQLKPESESKKSNLLVSATNQEETLTPASSPVMTTPAPEPTKKSAHQEDETAKIWKILEEASRSLEPVEIQMDDDPIIMTNAPKPVDTSTLPIVSTSKNEEQINEETKDLVSLLETKEQNKAKQNASAKPTKAKGNNNQQQEQEQSVPVKTVDTQSQKTAVESKKKDAPAPKTAKNSSPGKSPQKSQKKTPEISSEKSPRKSPEKSPQESPEKTPEKSHEKSPEKKTKKTRDRTPQKTPPTETRSEARSSVDIDVPLDMFLSDQIDIPETSTESKNVQGSDFVPSVDQTTAEAKSLGPEAIAHEHPKEAEKKSRSPTIANEKKILEKLAETIVKSESVEKSIYATQIEKKSPEKRSSPNSKQKDSNKKTIQGKTSPNNKKANGKPVIPPKPEHLVSSQAKKSQLSGGKSAKTEKILVLTGANADDEDSEDDYIEYKFMPRQVFIATICQSCKKPTKSAERVLCQLCQMVSYCCADHVTKDEPIHKDLCTALQEIAKKRGGHIYNNARILNNNDYRSLRVHTLNLCENFLRRPLQTYEREILLFPRLCSTTTCREWRQNILTDCENCGQAFYCTVQPDHLIESHQRWCKSVALYRNLVVRQSISGRIEPSLPSRIQTKPYTLPDTIAEVFEDLYKNFSAIKEECVFATLTQLATAPLTAYFAAQKALENIGEKFTIHLIGAELQFEADVLDIWETFFLHLAHNLMELTIVFCGPELNAENIPLDIISRIRMCRACRQNCRIVKFDFQCAKFYHDYAKSSSYTKPDLICFFNPGFHHINSLNGFDTWSETIKLASTADCPVVVTSYTEYESPRDLDRFHNESSSYGKQMTLVHGPESNPYSSQRPERNFISDEIVPLIFKNYFCFVMK